MTKLVSCPLDNGEAALLFTKRGYPHYFCHSCGLYFFWPLPETEAILSVYGEGYRPDPHDPNYQEEGRAYAQTLRKNFYIDLPKGFVTRERTLLDIGCGFGFFLDAVRKDFKRVCGVEISEPLRAFAQKDLGLDILEGHASSIPLGDGSLDVVTVLDVLEHLPVPQACLQEICRVLKPGGILIVATPNTASLTARLLGQRWIYFTPPEHLHLFCPRTLVGFLNREGFEVLKVRTDSLLIHHILVARREREENERAAMWLSTAKISRAIRRRRLLKAVKDATNASPNNSRYSRHQPQLTANAFWLNAQHCF